MKNELLARAITYIDDELIEQANEKPAKRALMASPFTMRNFMRWGSLAACIIVTLSLVIATHVSGDGVRLYGEIITDEPRTITEFMPRSITHSIDPASLTALSLPLELEFDKSTTLTLENGSMEILDQNGETLYSGNQYTARGKISVCITLPPNTTQCKISTNRGYHIVLEQNEALELWYVSIEK